MVFIQNARISVYLYYITAFVFLEIVFLTTAPTTAFLLFKGRILIVIFTVNSNQSSIVTLFYFFFLRLQDHARVVKRTYNNISNPGVRYFFITPCFI